jgi:hypothetical protein
METADPTRWRGRARHNLDLLAWRPIGREQPATLDICDYVEHLKTAAGRCRRVLPDARPGPF